MRKLCLTVLTCFLSLCLTVPASAHSGKTDSQGGHYDHSTGEYHFHHGYPAHSHRDMNGDGILDCPYEFDDQTDHSSSRYSGSGSTRNQGSEYSRGYDVGYEDGFYEGKQSGASESYEAGYQNAMRTAESKAEAAYAEGYKEGETVALASTADSIAKAKKSGALAVIGLEVALFGPAAVVCEGIKDHFERRKNRKAKAKAYREVSPEPPKPKSIPAPPKAETVVQTSFYDDTPKAPPTAPRLGPPLEDFTIIKRSSAISAVCYKSGNLYVKTSWGEYLLFYRVPHPVYLDFMNAQSMGKFYHQHISGMYPFSQL